MPVVPVAVTLRATAVTPVVGSPLRPVTRRRVGVVVTRTPVVRVSRMRVGVSVVMSPPGDGDGDGVGAGVGGSGSGVEPCDQGVVMTSRMAPQEPAQPSTAMR